MITCSIWPDRRLPSTILDGQENQLDVLADQAAEHLQQLFDGGVHIQGNELKHLSPAEGQQLAGRAVAFPQPFPLPAICGGFCLPG